ncbi:MAG: UbiD family decarboxylase [Desulfovibrionaceae bacterium]|nr:UbiD family decarboxylase [Desulfovibrionaceae bacterium]
MGYPSLAHCVKDLEENGYLKRIDQAIDPHLELAVLARQAFKVKGPALLLTNVTGVKFPVLCNLFGTKERLYYIFRQELSAVKDIFNLAGNFSKLSPWATLKKAGRHIFDFFNISPRKIAQDKAAVLKETCELADLPKIISWPHDGGAFITLPIVYSEDPLNMGAKGSNLGMYRIQLDGGEYEADEVGLHYQIHRGIGIHHAHALAKGRSLPVHIYVGGPPALTLSAVMPLPFGLSELKMAGLLGGQGVGLTSLPDHPLPFIAAADFCLEGEVLPITKPEGPFGDHLGYYSLVHPFPVIKVKKVYHRPYPIWPCTFVGRPPQEDTIFGEFIHELTEPVLSTVFPGVVEVRAVDAAGVHPLLLALGSERYTPYEAKRKPREILTQALHLLGTTQTALAKYLLIMPREDAPGLSCRDAQGFLAEILARTNFAKDLHFLTKSTNDTLDYTGEALNEGSKLIWAVAGDRVRTLGFSLSGLNLDSRFGDALVVAPGILAISAPKHTYDQGVSDPLIEELAQILALWSERDQFPLVVVVDDAAFVAQSFDNWLWVTFTRSDPANDIYGANARILAKHWICEAPLIIDARKKSFHAPELVEDPAVLTKLLDLAKVGGPLEGCF